MRTIVGIDLYPETDLSIDFLARLKIPGNELTLVHSMVPISPALTVGLVTVPIEPNFIDELGMTVTAHLESEVIHAKNLGMVANYKMTLGSADRCLQEEAKAVHADLIALSASPHRELGSLLNESVSHSLAISAPMSVLIVRGCEPSTEPVSALFATDHSDYCNEAMERLMSWNLQGLSKVVVFSAYETVGHETALIGRNSAIRAEEVSCWLKEQVQTKTEAIARRFEAAGVTAEVVVVQGDFNDKLPAVMKATGSNLLILGARGHKFLERMMLGSTTVHQVDENPFPILIVRA